MFYDFSSTFFSVFPSGILHPGCLSSADLSLAWQCHAVFSRKSGPSLNRADCDRTSIYHTLNASMDIANLRLSNNKKRREPYLFDMPQRISIYWLSRKGFDMSKIEGLVLQVLRYAEQVKDATNSEARYNAAFELKLTAADSEAAVRIE